MRSAKAKPKAKSPPPAPGSAASIKQQTDQLDSAVALLRASQDALPSQDDLQAFSRAYGRWLMARASIKGGFPEDNSAAQALSAEERAALRALFSVPALYEEDVWQKFEAFEAELTDDLVIGQARDSLLQLGIGAIKTDLMNLGVGEAANGRGAA